MMNTILNKYYKWYYALIDRARNRTLEHSFEKHHIIPKSLGGSNKIDNICNLTYREHYICHMLLTRFTTGNEKYKMTVATWGMMKSRNIKPSSRLYESARQEIIKFQKGKTMLERLGPEKLAIAQAKYSAKRKGQPAKNKGTGQKNWFTNKVLNIEPIYIDVPSLIKAYPKQELKETSLNRVKRGVYSQHKGWQIVSK